MRRGTFEPVNTAAASRPARARLGTWPHERDVAHLVLLDHQMVPTAGEIEAWIAEATARGARAVRTGALFPDSVPAFAAAGFATVHTLTLLTQSFAGRPHRRRPRPLDRRFDVRRLRPASLDEAAAVDRAAFDGTWSNDATTLADIVHATPHHRSRCIVRDGEMVAFAISGRADRAGYVQRLAVRPDARRGGLARWLVDDALAWMQRRGADDAMVNTAADNEAAIALYLGAGFEPARAPLAILERGLRA